MSSDTAELQSWRTARPTRFRAARAYWVRRRLFQTVFVKKPKESDSPEVIRMRQQAETKFLDSFVLSNDVK